MNKLGLSPLGLNVFQTVVGFAGVGFTWLGANAAGFTGTTAGIPDAALASLGGLIGGYFVADLVAYENTGTVDQTVVANQVLDAINKAKQLPGLTPTELQALAVAEAMAKSKQAPA